MHPNSYPLEAHEEEPPPLPFAVVQLFPSIWIEGDTPVRAPTEWSTIVSNPEPVEVAA
jgi:hypothetical protein